jgi:RNA polymerase sigma factor (sigma-70 family)
MSNFEQIYEEHKNQVFNLALQYVQNYEDAQEITQDVFVSIHNSINSFKEQSKLSTWIYRIAINKSLDYIKAKKRKKRFGFLVSILHPETNEIQYDIPNFDHPGVQLEHKEAIENIFSLINELPDNQKTALILSKIEHKKQSEIADIMGLSTKSIESLIQRAKQNLSLKLNLPKENKKIIVKEKVVIIE